MPSFNSIVQGTLDALKQAFRESELVVDEVVKSALHGRISAMRMASVVFVLLFGCGKTESGYFPTAPDLCSADRCCFSNGNCTLSAPHCATNGACVICLGDLDCPLGRHCLDSYRCVACVTPENCASGLRCVDWECVK